MKIYIITDAYAYDEHKCHFDNLKYLDLTYSNPIVDTLITKRGSVQTPYRLNFLAYLYLASEHGHLSTRLITRCPCSMKETMSKHIVYWMMNNSIGKDATSQTRWESLSMRIWELIWYHYWLNRRLWWPHSWSFFSWTLITLAITRKLALLLMLNHYLYAEMALMRTLV